ncbi:MAG: hypothetical protein FJW36_21805 [Acidobacteria bacterium]|nr:hypothetical protein [Acidobacteriota bacterium]
MAKFVIAELDIHNLQIRLSSSTLQPLQLFSLWRGDQLSRREGVGLEGLILLKILQGADQAVPFTAVSSSLTFTVPFALHQAAHFGHFAGPVSGFVIK